MLLMLNRLPLLGDCSFVDAPCNDLQPKSNISLELISIFRISRPFRLTPRIIAARLPFLSSLLVIPSFIVANKAIARLRGGGVMNCD